MSRVAPTTQAVSVLMMVTAIMTSIRVRPARWPRAARLWRRVTPSLLAEVERAEDGLRDLGLRVVRVRHRGRAAAVELGGEDLARLEDLRFAAERAVRAAGFEEVSFDRYWSPTERAAGADSPLGQQASS
jgi:PP-loop superfamily ATP-utilizing enzyme